MLLLLLGEKGLVVVVRGGGIWEETRDGGFRLESAAAEEVFLGAKGWKTKYSSGGGGGGGVIMVRVFRGKLGATRRGAGGGHGDGPIAI